ncbi:ABC transporter permease [Aequorivita echinoideorum]|uniref:ABC transporter permease n=1 Tax=Aequorivita echinoideorum TaxID=1549647 RepID=A0ABS5S5A3_9FLAO|nr:ABC transporter permease [Aequorivita echinoideorum]MBT0608383.1 ABC transporter permease [Aequorivita echinoideorum]
MIALLQCELFKLWKQGKTWYALGAVLLIEIIILISAYLQGATVLELLLDNLRQSFYFEGNLLNGNLILYLVLNSLWFNVPLILMIITSAMITEEYKNGTLQTNLLQAISKVRLIIAKYLAGVIFTVFVLMVLMLSTFGLAYSIFGDGDLVVYLDTLNFFESGEAFKRICFAFCSGALSMLFYSTVSITLGILLKEPAKTWIASAFFLILCSLLLKADFGLGAVEAFLFPKLINSWQQFFQYELDWTQIITNNLLLAVYTILFAALGCYFFNKKDIG